MSWSKLGVGLMHVLARLPLPVLRGLGRVLGNVLYVVAAPRRKWRCATCSCAFPK
jgi:hypothetical protein